MKKYRHIWVKVEKINWKTVFSEEWLEKEKNWKKDFNCFCGNFLNFQVFDSQNCTKNSKNDLYLSKNNFSRLELSLNKLWQLLTTLLISSNLDEKSKILIDFSSKFLEFRH